MILIEVFIDFSLSAQARLFAGRYSSRRFIDVFMSTAIDYDLRHGLSDTLLFSFLSTALSSAAVCFVLIMWFDLLP
ncbi:hypothetical protein MITS9509_01937 [Synechococcus sp. MIT S9509]|nr:hypothetical protein MITS9504_01736 [Synechococcus sp. MIT S9504]KZR92016.1 hypothetical protein MITS9509_01937 [Synechococcus sp. MIT S9509]